MHTIVASTAAVNAQPVTSPVHLSDDRDAVRASVEKWAEAAKPKAQDSSKPQTFYGIYVWMGDDEPWLRVGRVYKNPYKATARAVKIQEMYFGDKGESDEFGPIGPVSMQLVEVRPIMRSPRFDIYKIEGDQTYRLFKNVPFRKASALVAEHRSNGYKTDVGEVINLVLVPSDQPTNWFDKSVSDATNRDVFEVDIETGKMWEIQRDLPLSSAFCTAHDALVENSESAILILPPNKHPSPDTLACAATESEVQS